MQQTAEAPWWPWVTAPPMNHNISPWIMLLCALPLALFLSPLYCNCFYKCPHPSPSLLKSIHPPIFRGRANKCRVGCVDDKKQVTSDPLPAPFTDFVCLCVCAYVHCCLSFNLKCGNIWKVLSEWAGTWVAAVAPCPHVSGWTYISEGQAPSHWVPFLFLCFHPISFLVF